jgi:hypothetical protein
MQSELMDFCKTYFIILIMFPVCELLISPIYRRKEASLSHDISSN